jgi:NAD(P)-dependent dehydrogenase (short-subunit alcohol dehydrogenase family)
MSGRLDGQVALVTGGGPVRGWALDVTDPDAVAKVVEEAEAELGPVTLLVNNAGTAHLPGPLWEVDPDDWWRDLEVHVRGAFNCCRVVLPGMTRRRQGRVVNIGSLVGARDEPHVSAYACAKAAYFRLTGALAAETAGDGLTVLCVSPGLVRTRMVEESLLGEAGRRWRPQIAAIPAEEYTPAQRVGVLLVRIAAGDADPLNGRFLHAEETSTSCWPTRPGSPPTTCSPCACGSGRGPEDSRSRCRHVGVGLPA